MALWEMECCELDPCHVSFLSYFSLLGAVLERTALGWMGWVTGWPEVFPLVHSKKSGLGPELLVQCCQ